MLGTVLLVGLTLSSFSIWTFCAADAVSEHLFATNYSTKNKAGTDLTHRKSHISNINSSYTTDGASDKRMSMESYSDEEELHEVSVICPGAAEYLESRATPGIFRVSVSDCRHPGYDPRSRHAVVYGVCNDSTTFCQFLVQVHRGLIVRVLLQTSAEMCRPRSSWHARIHDGWPSIKQRKSVSLPCVYMNDKVYLSTSNTLYVSYYNSPTFPIQFQAVEFGLAVVPTSNFSGYVTSLVPAGFQLQRTNIHGKLKVPHGHIVMINFQTFNKFRGCFEKVLLLWKEQSNSAKRREFIHDYERLVHLYATTHVEIQVILFRSTTSDFRNKCMNMLFSFHPEDRVPRMLENGLYNCSVDDYWRFQQHLDCNLKVECEDGRDEAGHCPYSSPACQGWIASRSKCYSPLRFVQNAHPMTAQEECQKEGLTVATIKTNQELTDFQNLFLGRSHPKVFIGLSVASKLQTPFMYRRFYIWFDNTPLYETGFIKLPEEKFAVQYHQYKTCFGTFRCKMTIAQLAIQESMMYFACEQQLRSEQKFEVSVPKQVNATFTHLRHAMTTCPEGHVTHAFLSCDVESRCGQTVCSFLQGTENFTEVHLASNDPTAEMYTCPKDGFKIPYTLLCDFREDCQDKNDESFCRHPRCDAFSCGNGECVAASKRCDRKSDCMNSYDEDNCGPRLVYSTKHVLQQQLLINLDGKGYYKQEVMNVGEACPDTHFRCTSEKIYCMPVYTRCNGFHDCVYQEDEHGCEHMTCPGFYRCRASDVCVHADHMCDGWPQCPQRDDEWLCDMTCPAQCLCQGHAFLCPQPFSAHLFPQLRYLDARGSGMSPTAVQNNSYLIHLNLARCFISFLPDMKLPNLQVWDLSYNQLTNMHINIFLALRNLRTLFLNANPLTSVTSPTSELQHGLQQLDLSVTRIVSFDSKTFRHFHALLYLNVSFSNLQSLGPGGFRSLPRLKELDMRGNLVNYFPTDIFYGLRNLAMVLSSDYKFCCKGVLPDIFPETRCSSPQHFLSSCENMIQSEVYRPLLWLVAIIAIVGNMACLIACCAVRTIRRTSNYTLLTASLQAADLCMGLYATIITAAQEKFRGQYIYHEDGWKGSVPCKVAGFVSLLSSEVTVLVIFFLTLHHLLVLHFPLSVNQFCTGSMAAVCGVAWLVGSVLATIPLLSVTSHLAHYGQTAVCSLVLQDRGHLQHDAHFFHIVLAFNCSISLTVSVCLVLIYRSLPKHKLLTGTTNKPPHVTVEALMRMAAMGAVTWFSIAAVSVLVSAGAAGLEVSVFMAVVVLPLCSAVNPLLSLWHLVVLSRAQQREKRLLCVLKSRIKSRTFAINHTE